MPNDKEMTNEEKKKYDLSERTFVFSQKVLGVCSRIPKSHINNPMVTQLVRSATSVGANYAEADAASSKKDFLNKLAISKKEVCETKYWLRLLSQAIPAEKPHLDALYDESHQLNLIFSSIIRNSKVSH